MEKVGREEMSGRTLFVLDVPRPDDVPAVIHVPGPYFVCLLAWDAQHASAAEVEAVAARLLDAGCVYAVCWGPDCERVHDAFDAADIARRPNGPWAMTTWHSKDSLPDVIWFALFTAWPDDAFADGCRSVVAVSVGSPAWAAELRTAFTAPGEFSAGLLGSE
jgi:hypothetical protein